MKLWIAAAILCLTPIVATAQTPTPQAQVATIKARYLAHGTTTSVAERAEINALLDKLLASLPLPGATLQDVLTAEAAQVAILARIEAAILALAPPPVCIATVSPTVVNVPPTNTSGVVTVAIGPGCAWTAAVTPGTSSWFHLAGITDRAGAGSVAWQINENELTAPRSSTLTIAGVAVVFTQAVFGPPPQGLLIDAATPVQFTASDDHVEASGYTISVRTPAPAAAVVYTHDLGKPLRNTTCAVVPSPCIVAPIGWTTSEFVAALQVGVDYEAVVTVQTPAGAATSAPSNLFHR